MKSNLSRAVGALSAAALTATLSARDVMRTEQPGAPSA